MDPTVKGREGSSGRYTVKQGRGKGDKKEICIKTGWLLNILRYWCYSEVDPAEV